MTAVAEMNPHIVALVRLAVERVAADPADEQRYLELNFALDRAVERDLRYRELLDLFEEGAAAADGDGAWGWRLAAALAANLMGDTPRAVRWLEETRAGLESAGHIHTALNSFAHGELARACYHSAQHLRGNEAANRALQIARAANSLCAEAYAHHYLGLISVRRRDYDYARRHLDAARDLFERMHQRQARARVLDSIAVIEMENSRYDLARELLQESLGVKEDLRDLRGLAITCGSLARLFAALGDYRRAQQFLDRKRELIRRVGDERNDTLVLVQLGELHVRHGNPELAREELLAARSLARHRCDERLEAYACFTLAEAEFLLGHSEDAREAINCACAYFMHGEEAVMRERSLIRRALGNGESLTSAAINEPLERLRQSGAWAPLADALFETASFFHLQAQGDLPGDLPLGTGLEDGNLARQITALYAEALDAAEPTQADQMAVILRSRASNVEGRAWVDAMLTVKQHKDELEQAYAGLRRAESLRQSLVQMIVHDLKNPLTAIMPWLQTVQMGVLSPEEVEEYLQLAIDECEYLLRMIEDLNDVGKMQHETSIELHREPLDLPDMVRDVARRLQARARDSRISIRVEPFPPDLPPVTGDRVKLRRVLENLVSNSIKYGRPPEGSPMPADVRIALQREAGIPGEVAPSVRVEVRDFGVGIPVGEADRVFEPYYQAEAGRKRKAGVGLGLAFCRLVLTAHGGTIWTEPNSPNGSIFAFRLPAAEPLESVRPRA